MSSTMRESIEILKKAQDIDRDIYQAKLRLERIPEERAKIQRDLEAEKVRSTDLEQALRKLQLAQKDKEGQLAAKETNVKKLEGQLSQVKTNKEYAALQQEIASVKADNSLLEEAIIRLFDEVEAAGEEVKKEKERLKQIEKEFAVKTSELAQTEKTAASEIEDLKKRRIEIMSCVDREIRERYDLIVEKKQGLALVKVTGEICGACQLQLRPQVINELRGGEAIVICENCSRILFYEETK
jgi:predicted  nucleic acid-binding Zn-ribbon protein